MILHELLESADEIVFPDEWKTVLNRSSTLLLSNVPIPPIAVFSKLFFESLKSLGLNPVRIFALE